GEICNKKKNGELFWEQVNISPIKDENNDISHYVAVKIDITEKRKAEEEILRAKEAAESANKAKSEFLANMSHEIRTPMNAILGFAELLHAKIEDEQQLSFLDSIKSSGKNLLTIINDVLDLSKVEAGKMVVSKEFVDLFLLLKDIEYMFKLKAVEKGLEFSVEVDFNIPAGIETDEVRLRQILINIIGNAIKFTSNGYVKVKAHSRKISDKFVDITIEVEDTGIGMSKEYLKKLFEPFTQEDSQITKRFGGTGLGLSISKKLIELLNGEIFVESEQGKGSRFTVVFHEVRFTHKEQKELELIQISPENIKFDSALVLIADDVAANRKYFKSVLQDTNLRIIESENGLETFEKAKIYRPDILITDLKMPGCNGFELFRMLREDHSFDNMKIVATTATASIEERDKLQVHKFDGLLIKPIQVNDVFIELMRLLPHEVIDNTEKIERNNIEEVFNIEQNNEYLFKILESEMMPIWETFESQQPLDEVEGFAKKIREIGQEYSCEPVISYGNLLVRAINNFDIDAMLKNLNDFPKLISTFKKDN
ncbi:MAG TPA: ATP-binding protein, partial [Bacteroidales bacterium]